MSFLSGGEGLLSGCETLPCQLTNSHAEERKLMAAYIVALITIDNPAQYQKYVDGFSDVLGRHQGRMVFAEMTPTVLEGDWHYSRTVTIEFPSRSAALGWYNSREYRELSKLREGAARVQLILTSEQG
jgi:uncharacterized protein (DUF1330 family)